MNRREFIRNTGVLGMGATGLANSMGKEARAAAPNILHLQVDQMTAAAIANRSVCRMPNVNRLASEGILFERSYTANAVCCPSRAILCTGAFPWHNGIFNQVHSAPSVHRDLFHRVTHYSQRLKERGYRQGYVGKWHASFLRTPLAFGYDEISGPTCYNPRLLKGIETDPDGVGPQRPGLLRRTVDRWSQWPGSDPFVHWGHLDGPEEDTEPGWVAENGIRMLRRLAASDGPWHLEIQILAPHDPYLPLKKYLDGYDPKDIAVPKSFHDAFTGKPEMHRRESESWGQLTETDYREGRAHYFAFCEQVDAQIGRILDVLKATGQDPNTLVAFTSDHGDMAGNHRMWGKGWYAYEDCYRVPMVLRWPNRIRPGLKTSRLVQVHDLAHTYIDAAGAGPLSHDDGRSLLPLVDDPDRKDWPEEILCAYYGCEFTYTQRLAITARHKYIFNGFGSDELYDLEGDPEELINLVTNPGSRAIVDDMRARLYGLMERFGDPFGYPGRRFDMPDSSRPDRYGAPRYLPRGQRIGTTGQ